MALMFPESGGTRVTHTANADRSRIRVMVDTLFESILATLAYASVIVSTLRAGSRALYLAEHESIGLMKGPLILGPDDVENRSLASKVWDLSHPFQQGVRLDLFPNLFQYEEIDLQSEDSSTLWNFNSTNQTTDIRDFLESDTNNIEEIFPDTINETIFQFSTDQDDYFTPDTDESSLETQGNHHHHPDIPTISNSNRQRIVPRYLSNWYKPFWNSTLWKKSKAIYRPFRDFPAQLLLLRSPEMLSLLFPWRVLFKTRKLLSFPPRPKGRFFNSAFLRSFIQKQSLLLPSPTPWDKSATCRRIFFWGKQPWEDSELEYWDYQTQRTMELQFQGVSDDTINSTITAYAPKTFADLRSRFGISSTDFQFSLLEAGPYISFQSNSKGAARSGGLFFFTRDGAYMIKTIKKAEAKALLNMLPKYHKYMQQYGRTSLLTRFCGMYTVKLSSSSSTSLSKKSMLSGILGKETDYVFVIMNSVFPAEGSHFISERYDLKGSTVGRECTEEEKISKGNNAVLKDLDLAKEVEWIKLKNAELPSGLSSTGFGFQFGPTFKSSLLSQLRRDVKLLVECQVMDYSLLVGVVHMDTMTTNETPLPAAFISHAKKRYPRIHATAQYLLTPLQIMSAPALYMAERTLTLVDSTLSSILTRPLPYYGAGLCVVDGGSLAKVEGKRRGKRAIYYLGLIDFLQPWTAMKVAENQLKGWMGYDTQAISCVAPEFYGSRFLEFIENHVC
jgi:Phosphatidylinositol-4-phosphate 5-Kinase